MLAQVMVFRKGQTSSAANEPTWMEKGEDGGREE